jgi:hypothetical protein
MLKNIQLNIKTKGIEASVNIEIIFVLLEQPS